jgi:T5SS/PEP-CTERM-associated repeat protein
MGSLFIVSAGQVTDVNAYVGFDPNAVGEVQVSGAGSLWAHSGLLSVGANGLGTMEISSGGVVTSAVGSIGGYDPNFPSLADYLAPGAVLPNGTGAVVVTGAGSTWDTGLLGVGLFGNGTLVVNDGGSVGTVETWIGVGRGIAGTVNIDGAGSSLTTVGDVAVGVWGQGSLTVSGGAQFSGGSAYLGGVPFELLDASYDPNLIPDGTGTVTVTGAGSTLSIWGNENLYVGYYGSGALDVNDGAYVQSDAAGIAAMPGSTGTATIDGSGSAWDNDGPMYVGGYGQGTLTISNGSQVSIGEMLFIGGFETFGYDFPTFFDEEPNGTGIVSVTGAGSLLQGAPTTSIYVGYLGDGTLDISAGGRVTAQYAYIGHAVGSQGTVRISDANSLWDVTEILFVGGDSDSAGGTGSLMVGAGATASIGSSLFVWERGTIGGSGTIDTEAVINFGAIAPGDSVGTLTVTGNVMFDANSVFEVEIDSNDTADELMAAGDVDIQSATVQAILTGTVAGTSRHEIVEANSVSGTFGALDTALLHFFITDAALDYDPNSVWLSVTALPFDDPNIWQTCNQARMAGALQQIAEAGGNDVTDALQALDDINDIRLAYDQLAGQTRPPLAPVTVAGTSKFLGQVSNRVQTVKTGLMAAVSDSSLVADARADWGRATIYDVAPQGRTFDVGNGSAVLPGERWGVWGGGYGLYGDRRSENGTPGYDYDLYGGSIGLDYRFTQRFLGGVVGGLAEGDVEFSGSRDNSDLEAAYVGLYGSLAWDEWYVDVAAVYASLQYNTERFVDLFGERLTGQFDGSEIAAYVEAGLNWELAPNTLFQPLISLQYASLDLDSYTESGGVSALSFDEQTYDSVRGSLGARLMSRLIRSAREFHIDGQLRGRWVHEFGDERSSVDAHFASDPAAVFTVSDEELSPDSAVLGAGLSAALDRHTRVYVDYDTRLNRDESLYVISAALQYRW